MTRALKGTSKPLAQQYQLALLDLDGVVYRGKEAVAYAADSIQAAQHAGMAIEYTTNNSSRFQQVVADQLKGFGLDVEPWQVITSSVVAARMVAKRVSAGARVLVLGADHLREEVIKAGLTIVEQASDNPEAVIQGWYPDMTWTMLAELSYAVENGATYFTTNRDLTIPREFGIAPGCGSMIQAVVNATGTEPVASAGKPEAYMYDEARELNATQGTQMVSVEASLAIGDRLDTDIEAGNCGGYDSLAVLTGVTNPHEIMLAPEHLRPTYVVRDLRGLLEAMPEPTNQGNSRWSCASASSWLEDKVIKVSDVTDINAVRAAVCLAWQLADSGQDMSAIELPEFALEEE